MIIPFFSVNYLFLTNIAAQQYCFALILSTVYINAFKVFILGEKSEQNLVNHGQFSLILSLKIFH